MPPLPAPVDGAGSRRYTNAELIDFAALFVQFHHSGLTF